MVLRGQHGFEREHHPGDLTGGSDGAQRPGRLAQVGSELKLNRVQPGGLRGGSRQAVRLCFDGHLEMALAETERAELFHDRFG